MRSLFTDIPLPCSLPVFLLGWQRLLCCNLIQDFQRDTSCQFGGGGKLLVLVHPTRREWGDMRVKKEKEKKKRKKRKKKSLEGSVGLDIPLGPLVTCSFSSQVGIPQLGGFEPPCVCKAAACWSCCCMVSSRQLAVGREEGRGRYQGFHPIPGS